MSLYQNIKNRELPMLLRTCYKENGGDMEAAAHDLETLDLMLGVLKNRSLINARDRKSKTRWARGRNFSAVMEGILLRETHGLTEGGWR